MPRLVTGNRDALTAYELSKFVLRQTKADAVISDDRMHWLLPCVVFNEYFSRVVAVVNNYFNGAIAERDAKIL